MGKKASNPKPPGPRNLVFKGGTDTWIRGTVDAVKAWIRKETDGMVSKSEERDFDYSSMKWREEPWGQIMRDNLKKKIEEKEQSGNWKPTNPKDLLGIRKVSFCCVPFTVLGEVSLGMQEGAMKYGRHNYRDEGVAVSTYIDAAIRHLGGFWEGEDIDPESGVHHISKAISTLVVLRDAMLNEKCTDDRPLKPRNPDWLVELNAKASALVDKYPTPEKPYTEKPLPEGRVSVTKE